MSQFVEEDESQQSDYEIGLYTVEDLQNITMEALNEALKQKRRKRGRSWSRTQAKKNRY